MGETYGRHARAKALHATLALVFERRPGHPSQKTLVANKLRTKVLTRLWAFRRWHLEGSGL
jgi:hypothetical protein